MKMIRVFFLLASSFTVLLVTGCGGPGAPGVPAGVQATVETDYGLGLQNVGYTMVDPNVRLNISGDDPTCSNGQGINYFAAKTSANGQASFGVTCNGELILVSRYPDTGTGGTNNCDFTNRTDSQGNGVYLYNPFPAYPSPPTKLPCGSVTSLIVLSPSLMFSTSPVSTFTMTGPVGTFTSTYGLPWVFITDPTGSLLGQEIATSVSVDGSSITFSGAPLISPQGTTVPGNYVIAVSNVVPSSTLPPISGSPVTPQPNIGLGGPNSLSAVAGAVLSVTTPAFDPQPPPCIYLPLEPPPDGQPPSDPDPCAGGK